MALIAPRIEFKFKGEDMKIGEGFRRLWYFESVYGCASYRLLANAPSWGRWDKVITDGGKTPAKLRFGWSTPLERKWSDWKEVLVNHGNFQYRRPTLDVGLNGTCAGFKVSETFKEKAYRDKTVSDIVEEIAERNGLKADVETTKGKKTYYQCRLPDGRFIKKVLLPKSISSSGRTDFYFWIKDGKTLVFRPPDLSKIAYRFRLSLNAFLPNPQDVDFLSVRFRRAFLADDHSLKTLARGYDPIKKEIVQWEADENTVDYEKLAPKSLQPPDDPSRVVLLNEPHGPKFKRKDVEDVAKSEWSKNLHGLFRVTLRVGPLVKAAPATVVFLDVRDAKDQPHFLGGKYFVYAIAHKIARGRYDTILYLERRTFQ